MFVVVFIYYFLSALLHIFITYVSICEGVRYWTGMGDILGSIHRQDIFPNKLNPIYTVGLAESRNRTIQ